MTTITGTIKTGGTAIDASYFPADWVVVSVDRAIASNTWSVSATAAVASDATFSIDSPDGGGDREIRLMACQPFGRPWETGVAVAAGAYCHKSTGLDGVVFRAGGSGTMGASEPTWDTTHGNTTADNGITWTAVEYLSMSDTQGSHTHIQYGIGNLVSLLFSDSQNGLMTNIQDISTLWEDTSATTPATVDNPVRRIDDVSGNAKHLTAITNYAILRQDVNAKYYLEFPDSAKALFTFTELTDVRSVLMAYKDTSPSYTPFLGHVTKYPFHGGISTQILDSTYAATSVKNGVWRKNGSVITPTAADTRPTSLSIVTCVTTAAVAVNRFIDDRGSTTIRFDGEVYEIIISSEAWDATKTAAAETEINAGLGASGPL